MRTRALIEPFDHVRLYTRAPRLMFHGLEFCGTTRLQTHAVRVNTHLDVSIKLELLTNQPRADRSRLRS